MVVLTESALDHISLLSVHNPSCYKSVIPVIDLSKSDSKRLLVTACEELGFFKVVNHGVPLDLVSKLESQALEFFGSSSSDKEKAGPAEPYGYGNKKIGRNGDMGWLEYLLFQINSGHPSPNIPPFLVDDDAQTFGSTIVEYVKATRKLASEVLEMLAEGLKLHAKDELSKLVMNEDSDCVFRLNYYPQCPRKNDAERNVIGFGEHTDPQIISVLMSNNARGLQISLKDGSWTAVPPDPASFFVNVGDSLQVLTNGRLRSVRHRVVANSIRSRLSMIFFAGTPLGHKILPPPELMREGEQKLYREFTWSEYKSSVYESRLADDRLALFEI